MFLASPFFLGNRWQQTYSIELATMLELNCHYYCKTISVLLLGHCHESSHGPECVISEKPKEAYFSVLTE